MPPPAGRSSAPVPVRHPTGGPCGRAAAPASAKWRRSPRCPPPFSGPPPGRKRRRTGSHTALSERGRWGWYPAGGWRNTVAAPGPRGPRRSPGRFSKSAAASSLCVRHGYPPGAPSSGLGPCDFRNVVLYHKTIFPHKVFLQLPFAFMIPPAPRKYNICSMAFA